MNSRRTFLSLLIASPLAALVKPFRPRPVWPPFELLPFQKQFIDMMRRRPPSNEITFLTDSDIADKFKKHYARQAWYYERHLQRKARWEERSLEAPS